MSPIYVGTRLGYFNESEGRRGDRVSVLVDGEPLDPRFDLRNHSPDGFEWGYGGSGPSQLSLALSAHALRDDRQAQSVYQDFKFAVVAKLPFDGWVLTDYEIRHAIEALDLRREMSEPPQAVE